jgi:hypothetical protein
VLRQQFALPNPGRIDLKGHSMFINLWEIIFLFNRQCVQGKCAPFLRGDYRAMFSGGGVARGKICIGEM